ncbi:GHKL domain-containing protein [Anaerostipes hadrus]|uniref:GHKL domain-containing protein n=2 Tax=Anaerostipes hadrus TaxID=649756 RepID=UPI003A87807E
MIMRSKKTDSGFFLSSRRKNCVGTGLKSVTAICKKYDGHLSIETDNHRFKVKMFLQC